MSKLIRKIKIAIMFLLVTTNSFAFNIIGIQSGEERYFYKQFYYTMLQLSKDKYICLDDPLPMYHEMYDNYNYMIFLWEWITEHDKCDKIKLIKLYDGKFDKIEIENNIILLQKDIMENEIDLIVSFGNILSKANLTMKEYVPKISLSVVDPILSKLLIAEQKKYNIAGVVYIKNLQLTQMKYYYETFKFKHLGLLFEDTPNGRIFSGFIYYKDYLLQNNVEISVCHTKEVNAKNNLEREDSILHCIDELIEHKVDAVYLSFQIGYTSKVLKEVGKKLIKNKIKSFYQLGEFGVLNGILLTYYPKNFNERNGYLYAKIIEKLYSGMLLSEIDVDINFEDFIPCYNKETAKELGIKIDDIECLY